MAHAYTPGLKVSTAIRHRTRRILPIPGEVIVHKGDRVDARDVVARTFMPGDIVPINLSNKLSLPPGDVPECMLKSVGDQIEVGDVLARTKGIFGFFKAEYASEARGVLEAVSEVTGQLILRGDPLPVEVTAFMSGTVIEVIAEQGVVIESEVSLIQGIFGIGGETCGPVRVVCERADQELTENLIDESMRGAVIVGGARMTGRAIHRAIDVGAAAVVSGGMDDQDLKEILGYDLGVAITGSEQIGTTLVMTEGFGEIAMAGRTFALLKSREGQAASVNGATQIRAGVMRPEIVIPLTEEEAAATAVSEPQQVGLDIGTSVRLIRDPWFGRIGSVKALPSEPQVLGSESRARVLDVSLDDGEVVTVPRANVELIEE